MTPSEFKPIGQSAKRLFGPRKILICGYGPKHQQALLVDLAKMPGFENLPIIFAQEDDTTQTMKTIFAQEHKTGQGKTSSFPTAIIMAGLTEKELHMVMAEYKKMTLPSPIWATLTPTSATWTLSDLLQELGREKKAMQNIQAGERE